MIINGITTISSCINTHKDGNELFFLSLSDLPAATHLEDFISKLDSYLPAAVFSRRRLKELNDNVARGLIHPSVILDEARDCIKPCSEENIANSGELGEILLCIFSMHVKNAFKLVSKFMNRERLTRNILGRDSIYGFMDEGGNVFMLMGESKTEANPNTGLKKAHEGLNKFWQEDNVQINHEISLANSHIGEELSEQNLPLYETFFIKSHEDHKKLQYKNIVFLGYSLECLTEYVENSISLEEVNNRIAEDIKRCFDNQKTLIENTKYPSIYFFLPFICVNQARLQFARHNGRLS